MNLKKRIRSLHKFTAIWLIYEEKEVVWSIQLRGDEKLSVDLDIDGLSHFDDYNLLVVYRDEIMSATEINDLLRLNGLLGNFTFNRIL